MELHDYVNALRKRWWAVLLAALIGCGLGLGYTAAVKPSYTATSRILFNVEGIKSVDDMNASSSFLAAQLPTLTSLATTPVVVDAAAQSLSLDSSDLASRVTAQQEPQTAIVMVEVTAGSQKAAADQANALVESYAKAAEGLTPGGSSAKIAPHVIQPAVAEGLPASPSRALFAALGLVAGGLIGLAVCAALASMTREAAGARRKN